jgi:hypothetical protein
MQQQGRKSVAESIVDAMLNEDNNTVVPVLAHRQKVAYRNNDRQRVDKQLKKRREKVDLPMST